MHQNSEAKQPKETDEIKKKLESYAALHRRIDNQIERLENLEAVMGSISSPSFDGISGGGGDGTSKQERQVIQKVTLEETIRRMITDEDRERSELEALISEMEKPDEQTLLEMHYFDAANWWTVCAALHGSREDYDEHEQRYLKRTFKLHGSALQSLAKNIQSKTRTGITTPARSHRKADGGLFCAPEEIRTHSGESRRRNAHEHTGGIKRDKKG